MDAKKLAEEIFRMYEGGQPSDDSEFDEEDFEDAVQAARAYAIKRDYYTAIKMEGERMLNPTWFEDFDNVPVVKNTITDSYYSILPSQVFGDLPKSRAMNLICPTQDPNNPFIPMSKSEIWLYSSLPQDDTIYYNFSGERVSYSRFDPSITEVFMQYIPQTSEVIPDELAHEIKELVLNQFLKIKNAGIIENQLSDANPNRKDATSSRQ